MERHHAHGCVLKILQLSHERQGLQATWDPIGGMPELGCCNGLFVLKTLLTLQKKHKISHTLGCWSAKSLQHSQPCPLIWHSWTLWRLADVCWSDRMHSRTSWWCRKLRMKQSNCHSPTVRWSQTRRQHGPCPVSISDLCICRDPRDWMESRRNQSLHSMIGRRMQTGSGQGKI